MYICGISVPQVTCCVQFLNFKSRTLLANQCPADCTSKLESEHVTSAEKEFY